MKFEKPKSSIERVAGAPPELEEKILKHKAEVFDDQIFESMKGKEREKSAEDLEMIAIANNSTNVLRKKYGMDNFDVPAKNFHMVPKEKWPPGEDSDGIYSSSAQSIAIKDADESRLYTLSKLIHESLHFKSYNALQILSAEKTEADKKPELSSYRVGFATYSRNGKIEYFSELNEAMTEELSKRILSDLLGSLRHNPIFSEEIQKTEEIANKYSGAKVKSGKLLFTGDTLHARTEIPNDLGEIIRYMIGKRSPTIKTESHTYRKQRRMLNSLMDKIWNKHHDKFKDQEEVFDVFARSYMTGNLLPIGRLIEDTFGKGTFRNIAELDMSSKKKEPPKSA